MKKSYVSYVAPEVELVEMVVETGFLGSDVDAFSLDNATYKDYNEGASIW